MSKAIEAAIQKELREQRVIMERILYAVGDRDRMDTFLEKVEREADFRRFLSDSGLYKLGVPRRGRNALASKDIKTLEEVCTHTREEIAALPEVGAATMQKLDAALAEREFTWAGAG